MGKGFGNRRYRGTRPGRKGGHGRPKRGGRRSKRGRTPVGGIDQNSKSLAEESEEAVGHEQAEAQVSNKQVQKELAADGVEGTEEHDLLSAAAEELENELAAKAEADLEEEEKTETSEDPSKASVPAGSSKASVPAGSAKQNRPSGAGEFRPDIIDNPVPIYPIEGYTSGRIPIPPQLQGLSPDQIQFSKVDGKMTARDRVKWRAAEQTARGTQRRNELDLIAREKERDIRVRMGEAKFANVNPADMPPPTMFAIVKGEQDEQGFATYRLVPISPDAKWAEGHQGNFSDLSGSYIAARTLFVNAAAVGDPGREYREAREAWEAMTGRPMVRNSGESWQDCVRRLAKNVANSPIPQQE
jgi:hypothetical protein